MPSCGCHHSEYILVVLWVGLWYLIEYSMIVKLLTDRHLEVLSLKRGCRGSPESTHVKMPHCWKSHALAQIY